MIQLDNLGVYLPQGYLYQNVNLQINRGEKIGLVGKNGAGKSTLFRLLAGTEKPSEGAIHGLKTTSIGWLTQDIQVDSNQSVFAYVEESHLQLNKLREGLNNINHQLVERTDYESDSYLKLLDDLHDMNLQFDLLGGHLWPEKVATVMKGLGFSDEVMNKPLYTFSGGWKMRAELAKILANEPDLMLLDEPTNHLDIITISWLERYLKNYPGTVMLISHDRQFLDNLTKRTIEIANGKMYDYPFSYTKYQLARREENERLAQAKKQQDKDIQHTKELIDKFRAKKNKAAFAQGLIKKLDRVERIEIEQDDFSKINIAFPLSNEPGKWVLEMDQLAKSYGENRLFEGVNCVLGRGEKIALLGPNGVGKSTLLKCVMNQIDYEGEVKYGHQVKITYFAQGQAEELDPDLTVLETVDAVAVGEIRKQLRSILGAFLFSGEEVDKKVEVLSGGEKMRLAMCQLLLSPSNFLILDEPTNHLDMASKEVLKSALKNYQGTFIVVSHDREFLDGLTNRIWDIDQKKLKIHHYGVKEFLANKVQDSELAVPKKPVEKVERKENSTAQKDKKTRNAAEQKVKKLEQTIADLEKESDDIQAMMAQLDYSNDAEVQRLNEIFGKNQAALTTAMEEWEATLEMLDRLEV